MTDKQKKLIKNNIALAQYIAHKWYETQNILTDYGEIEAITYLGLTKAAISYNPEKNAQFNTYARVCMENLLRNEYKKVKKYNKIINRGMACDVLVDMDLTLSIDMQIILEKYLTQEQREILLATYVDGYSQRDIAKTRGISQTKTNSTLKQAKEIIAKHLLQEQAVQSL